MIQIYMKTFFRELFHEHGVFLKTSKQVFKVHLSEYFLLTYFPLTINYYLNY